MPNLHPVLASAVLAIGLAACGGAPTDSESTGTAGSDLLRNPYPPPVLPPLSGVTVQWLTEPGGAPTSTLTLHYYQVQGTVMHDDAGMRVTLWDDLDAIGTTKNCEYQLTIDPTTPGVPSRMNYHTGGPLLCNGASFSLDPVDDVLGGIPSKDFVATAFVNAVGDDLQDVCAATNGKGVTIATTFSLYVNAYGQTPAGNNTGTVVVSGQPSVIDVTLECD